MLHARALYTMCCSHVSFKFIQVLTGESEEKRLQYVTQVTVGPLILTIHRHVLLAHFVARNSSLLGCDRSRDRQSILDICREAPLLYNNVPPAPFLYLLYIPSVIRFRFNGRRSLLQSALRRFILPQLVDL